MFHHSSFSQTSFSPTVFKFDVAASLSAVAQTEQGRSRPVAVRNILARFIPAPAIQSEHGAQLTPSADGYTPPVVGDFVTAESAGVTPTAGVNFSVSGIAASLEYADVSARGQAYVHVEGYASGADYARVRADASARVAVPPTVGAIQDFTRVHPFGVKNPTEEQLIAMINTARRSRRYPHM